MAPSTLGSFLRAFSFGHVRQLDAVIAESLRRAWALGTGPGAARLVVDVDSTICQVYGKAKSGAAYGYTKVLGYHPILAVRAGTGEVLHARMRKGSANTARGAKRFVEELVARARRAGASGEMVMRFDSGFWSNATIAVLGRLDVRYTMAVRCGNSAVAAAIASIDESAWVPIAYTPDGMAQVAEVDYNGHRLVVRRTRLVDAAQQALFPRLAPPRLFHRPGRHGGRSWTVFTASTPPSSWLSATSKMVRAWRIAHRGASTPMAPGWPAPCSPITSAAGPPWWATSTPTTSSPWSPRCGPSSSACPAAWSTGPAPPHFAARCIGPGNTASNRALAKIRALPAVASG